MTPCSKPSGAHPGRTPSWSPQPMAAVEGPKLDPVIQQGRVQTHALRVFRARAIEASISRYQVEIQKKVRAGLRLRGVRTAGRAARGAVSAGRPRARDRGLLGNLRRLLGGVDRRREPGRPRDCPAGCGHVGAQRDVPADGSVACESDGARGRHHARRRVGPPALDHACSGRAGHSALYTRAGDPPDADPRSSGGRDLFRLFVLSHPRDPRRSSSWAT